MTPIAIITAYRGEDSCEPLTASITTIHCRPKSRSPSGIVSKVFAFTIGRLGRRRSHFAPTTVLLVSRRHRRRSALNVEARSSESPSLLRNGGRQRRCRPRWSCRYFQEVGRHD